MTGNPRADTLQVCQAVSGCSSSTLSEYFFAKWYTANETFSMAHEMPKNYFKHLPKFMIYSTFHLFNIEMHEHKMTICFSAHFSHTKETSVTLQTTL